MKIERKNKKLFRVEVPEYYDRPIHAMKMAEWCQNVHGEESKKGSLNFSWRYGWVLPSFNKDILRITYFFYFKSEKDAMYFVLTWA
jgi:hypothetical protein